MQDNKLEIFRKSLEQANYNVPDSATFAETLSDSGKAMEFHKSLVTDNYDVPEDFETFSSVLGLKKKEASDYGLPTAEVLSQMFQNISKEDVAAQGYNVEPPKEFTTPDLSLKSPEYKGYEAPPLTQIIGQTLANDRIGIHAEEYKKYAETRISEIDQEITKLPQDNTEMLPAMSFSGGLILPTRPVSEEKVRLLKEKDDLKMAITTPGKLTYILGKAYNQSIIGLSDAIISGQYRAPEEWLNKYDASTLTDITATTLGFLLDMPFFGGMGKVGAKIGQAAAKPFVDRAMVKTAEKLIKAGFPETTAKKLALEAAIKTSKTVAGITSSGVALGSYGAVKSALEDWSTPGMDFDDIRWGQALKRGAKDFVLGIGVGGLGIASSAIASKASAIPNAAVRLGTKVGVAAGGLTAESGLFAYGGALLDGRKLNNVTGKEFVETVTMLAMLKISRIPQKTLETVLEPKKAAVKLYQSLRFKKPGEGLYAVDIEPWEIDAVVKATDWDISGNENYRTLMDVLPKDDIALGNVLKSEDIPALLKQKILWATRGVAIEDVDLYSDKVVANGEYVEVYNKEGVLVDKRKAPSREDAVQGALQIGLQLEDNKMQMKAAAPETDQVKIIGELKAKGTDITTVLNAVDKPVDERTIEENKIVGDYSKLVPKGDLKPPEPPIEEEVPKEIKKETPPQKEITLKGKKKKTPFKEGSRSYKAMNEVAGDFTDAVMQHFITGGRISREDFIAHTGWGEADIKKSGVGFLLSKGGQKLDVFNEALENSFGIEEKGPMDMINTIIDIVKSNPTRGKMLDAFEKRHKMDQPFEPTEEEIAKQESDEKFAKIIKENGGLNEKAMGQAAEAGLISKEELDTFKSELENENISREQSERELADEEERIAAERRDQGGGKNIPSGEEPGKGKEEPKPEINEEPINKPDITSGKEEGNIVPGGTEGNEKPIAPKGEEKPVREYTPVQQKQIDDINKKYDKEISDRQKELDAIPKKIIKAINNANKRIGIFGDLKPVELDEIIKREEQGFKVTSETVDAIRKPFLEREAELRKEIDALNKERESKIGEVEKQQTLGFEEPQAEVPGKITATKEGVKYGDKTYTDIVDVLDDIENGTLSKEDGQSLREAVNTWDEKNKPESFADSKTAKQNKRYKNEPKTDKPEELAWDEPLPLSPAEDPNFKMSDLNNAMSIRNIARSFVKNMGKIEGMDVRTGFIKRFARKARGLFNPDSGIIRVNNIRDLRALTHEFGHLLDYEIFDIRGIISAKAADKQLGTGVDFNGEIYSNVKQVEEAMKSHNITIDEGNFLLEKVKSFEKKKLGEKYSEIVEQGSVVPVKYKGKTYKSDKEINNALAKGIMPTAKASQLIVNLNNLNKGRTAKLDKLRAKYGDDVVAGVLQRVELKKEFDILLRDIGYPSKKRTEGIAEFVYNYVIDPKQLINSTPTALAWFEKMLDNVPAIKDALHTLREDFILYDAQDVLTKGVAEITPAEKEKLSWLDTIVTLGKEPMYSVVNMLRPMEVMVKKWKTMMDNNTLAYKDPWVSAKQLLGQGGRSEQWIIYCPYFNRGNDVILRKDIKGLIPIIKPLFGTTDYLPHQTYLVALDAIESHNRGKSEQAYFDRESAQAIKATAEKRFGVAKLMEFQSDIQKYNEALLDFAAESGIISKETAQYWKQEHQNYVPLRRIAETYEVFGGKRKTISRDLLPEAERVIFSRKGSQKQIRDIFESMIENTNHILASSERNILNRNIADMFTDIHNYNKSHKVGGAVIEEIDARGMEAYQDPTTGEIRYAIAKVRPKNFRPPKGRILVVREEGNPRFYDVAPEYYDDIFRVTNRIAKQVSGVMRILSAPSHWLQAGAVVYDPTFPIRNIVRDQTSTWFTSKYGYLPTDFLRGIMSAIKKDDIFQKWLASGGDQSFLISADQAMSQNYFDKKVGKFAKRKFDAYKRNPLLALQDFSKASEIGTRVGSFGNAYKKTDNVKLAAIESRDITADYGIHGAMTKQLFQLYPFLNARIQWSRTIVNTMKNPASFMLKGMAITIPAALNWLLNNQDEESQKLYQSLPTWRRVGLFNIRIPGTDHFLPLPKGFFGVLFASSIESLLDAAVKDDPRILKELLQQLFQEISPLSNWPEVIPFLVRPRIEMWSNKKGYTGKPIVSESMKLLKPSEQYYNSTPEIIKKIGETLNWSPVKIEHYFKSYTGGAGIGAINILDETLQAIGLVEKKPEDTFTMLSRMPIFKALLTERPVGLYSGHVSDFYETLDKIEKVNVTFNNFVKTENLDDLDKFMADPENKRMYSFYEGNSTALNSFRSALTFARDSMYAVMKDDLLTNIEKQQEVRKLNDVIQESVLKFKEAYEQNKFFDYGKEMSDIVTKMKEEKKDYRNELAQQQNAYNPYWMQLRQQNKDVYDRLREFGGLRDIEQTRTLTKEGKPLVLELEDVRRFNEILVKRYGENVKNMIGTNKSLYETYRKTTNPMDVEENQLQQLLKSAWDLALNDTKNDFKPQYSVKPE